MTGTWGPGLHLSIPELEYHALPGLSSTGIKDLLDCPARFAWKREHREEKAVFDMGHLIHGLVLGVGLETHVVDAPDWRSKAARDERDAARAEDKVPVLVGDYVRAKAAARAVRNHPDAGPLFTGGAPEVSILWEDPETGVRCRGRLDYWHQGPGVVVDLKTTGRTASPRALPRMAADLGWHTQAAHYLAGLDALTGRRADLRFVHVLVEVDEPHLVSVVELDADYLAIGADDVRLAIDTYARCTETGHWPGYPAGLTRIAPPRWLAATEDLEEIA
jgi:hypothetical protein